MKILIMIMCIFLAACDPWATPSPPPPRGMTSCEALEATPQNVFLTGQCLAEINKKLDTLHKEVTRR
jgi:hypothetical protein